MVSPVPTMSSLDTETVTVLPFDDVMVSVLSIVLAALTSISAVTLMMSPLAAEEILDVKSSAVATSYISADAPTVRPTASSTSVTSIANR